VFVPGKPFKSGLMFGGKARSLPQSGTLERCFNWVGSALPANIRLGWKGLPRANALTYYKKSELMAVKSFITLAPRL
jgi:hypothetical protein